MLISCYQCRQQMDVPEDGAGKRVRCPHCQYVIVVPAKQKPAESAEEVFTPGPAMALPLMELDAEGDKPIATTKVAAQPLPPYDLPPTATGKSKPTSAPPSDELPPMPSIDKSRRRRPPLSSTPPSNTRWGLIIGIGAVVGVVSLIVCIGVASSGRNRPRNDIRVAVKNRDFADKKMEVRPQDKVFVDGGMVPMPFEQKFGGFENPINQNPPMLAGANWQLFEKPGKFKMQFPGQPIENHRNVGVTPMVFFERQHADWRFAVAHATMTEAQFQSIAMPDRHRALVNHFSNGFGARLIFEQANTLLSGALPAHEWQFSFVDNRRLYASACYIRIGNVYHHYLLTAHAPFNVQRNHEDINRFFNSFNVTMDPGSSLAIVEEFDAVLNGGRRDNEFTALALHPTLPLALSGTADSRLVSTAMAPQNIPRGFLDRFTRESKPIEQLAFSLNGEWLASVSADEVQLSRGWLANAPDIRISIKGSRCAFTKDHHLLVADASEVIEYVPNTNKRIGALIVPDFSIRGFALSSDEGMVAVYDEKAIELWDRKINKRLGRIEAHDAAITTVAFAPDGKTLASASADRSIKLWNVETRTERAKLRQHAWTVWSLAFTPDGKHLASGGLDGMLLLWNLGPAEPQLVWAQSHQFPVRAVAFDSAGKHCYFTCKQPAGADPMGGRKFSRQVRKIAFDEMKPNPQEAARIVAQQAGLHLPTISMMSYLSQDGKTIVTTTDGIDNFATGNSLRIWDAATATLKYAHSMRFHGVLSPDGKWIAYSRPAGPNQGQQVQLLDVQTNRVNENALTLTASKFPDLLFTQDCRALWVLRHHEFVLFEIQTPPNGVPMLVQKRAIKLKEANDRRLVTIQAGRDQKSFLVELYAAGALARTRKLYALADGQELPAPKTPPGEGSEYQRLRQTVNEIDLHDFLNGQSKTIGRQQFVMTQNAIHPEGKYAVSSSSLNQGSPKITLWDVQERRPLLTLPTSPARALTALRFSPDGRFLACVTSDSWTRVVPMDWLLERKALLPCQPNEVAAP